MAARTHAIEVTQADQVDGTEGDSEGIAEEQEYEQVGEGKGEKGGRAKGMKQKEEKDGANPKRIMNVTKG